eukprot:5008399-Amphidinium_carterae.1
MKGNMSRSVKGQRCWSTCIEREILKQYGREEVQACAGGRQQTNAEMGKSFACDLTSAIMNTETASTELGADVVDHWRGVQECMRGVLDADQKGIGGSHSSDIKAMSAMNAVITLHVRNELALWDKSWMSALVPCHEVLVNVSSGATYLVQFVHEHAACCTRASVEESGIVRIATSSDSLEWVVITSLDDWQILPCGFLSPLTALSMGRAQKG